MVKEVGFFSVRRYKISSGELLFNPPYSFLSVRFGYGNQLLAFLGLSHWLFIAVLDLPGFSPNFYERHYFFFLTVFFLMARPAALSVAVAGIIIGRERKDRLLGISQ